MRHFASYIILAPLAAAMATGPALAQNIPPGQSCGGLFCDMGMLGHKVPVDANGQSIPDTPATHAMIQAETPPDPTHLPCHDFVCGVFTHRDDDAPPPAPTPVVVAPAPEEATAKPMHKTHRKHIAKVAAAASTAPPADAPAK